MRRLARNLAKPLAVILIATQLLLAIPASASGSGEPPCAGMASSATHHCPCCPSGADSMKDCLAACTLAAAITPDLLVIRVSPAALPAVREIVPGFASASDPPLKPPPIV